MFWSNTSFTRLGEALTRDVVFMNLISGSLITNVHADSELPSLVLKTRLLLQYFPLAATKLWSEIKYVKRCRESMMSFADEIHLNETEEDRTSRLSALVAQQCCMNNTHICDLQNERKYKNLSDRAWIGFVVEMVLLTMVVAHSALLASLLFSTKRCLSTATVLFVFNILFSNLLFLVSFVLFFSDLFDESPYPPVSEDSTDKEPVLVVAETLQTHLFKPKLFRKHLSQETTYSLAQNGSLLGLMHLLVLVLLSAIEHLDGLLDTLSKGGRKDYLTCGKPEHSNYLEIASRCDSTALFHSFGAFLLRGHTLFTLVFLLASVTIFTVTILYHRKVQRQHQIIHTADTNDATSPNRRREKLFQTLVLSIVTFFVSVLGQTMIELSVSWIDDREQISSLAKCFRYHVARILSFADPVLNPLIVVARTPALRRQLRSQWTTFRSGADSKGVCKTPLQNGRISRSRTVSGCKRNTQVKLSRSDRPVSL